MNLRELLDGCRFQVLYGDPGQADVRAGITYDSRCVTTGGLYIAMCGRHADGHAFVADAVARGAVAVLVERPLVEALPSHVCVVRVADTRAAAPLVAARYFGHPSRDLQVMAVTGTNGKTSISFMVEALLRVGAGARVGVIGTDGCRVGDEPITIERSTPTTPEAVELHQILRAMADRGADVVAMEASSRALALHRVDRTDIDVGMFTNLTPDHLDDHGSMKAYKQAKLLLFSGMCRWAVANADDPISADIAALMPDATTTYGLDNPADFRAGDLRVDATGTSFVLHHGGHRQAARVPFPGRFAVSNALATLAAGHLLGYDVDALADALEELPSIPGRFETYQTPAGVSVIVDYAHSPDSLEQVLTTIRGFAERKIVTVFGCGGDRDPSKRAPMGTIAGHHSDVVVVTSDNPRGEDPEAIIDEIMPGLEGTSATVERITDRRDAIARALQVAESGDNVLVAGKGAEPYQIVGERKLPFDDMQVIRELAGTTAATE
ncbi:UDP-N-acetylmuramoyl-L-alanyl-D-glutamate--2,6-diaminopimelate ligase [Nonomuraea sp. MG754425]|uniref:UDP-N-acetylmuramoyl-L-alanyl-D-glutamate--2, 6-diaminopimelate ligase n=1 Tax=Nonomuraea sp. MG754425 TaxID=2570319 RepID=UPI001F008A50|nr:UDP-N-acetylmuramoyl-L-alanyl-D-glutamate--2,6-diaminopimelate ligase [Nonomuraea sp. MG754425]MCF6470701.1 UDP-N-acetylmuramoyl-L-alanyl-D-glutamate--2,6-diaminopimelate ligase [Nonomuraea sp. MG754425]